MGLSTIASTGIASPAAKAGFNTANKLKNGASVADIANETKEKFGNDIDTFKKTVKTATGVGVAAGATVVAAQTGVAGKIANLIPDSVKTKAGDALKKAATSGVGKKAVSLATKAYTAAKTFAKAHPAATAVLAGIGLIGGVAIENVKKEGAKENGKIEQKYADILELKNAAAKDLG